MAKSPDAPTTVMLTVVSVETAPPFSDADLGDSSSFWMTAADLGFGDLSPVCAPQYHQSEYKKNCTDNSTKLNYAKTETKECRDPNINQKHREVTQKIHQNFFL